MLRIFVNYSRCMENHTCVCTLLACDILTLHCTYDLKVFTCVLVKTLLALRFTCVFLTRVTLLTLLLYLSGVLAFYAQVRVTSTKKTQVDKVSLVMIKRIFS